MPALHAIGSFFADFFGQPRMTTSTRRDVSPALVATASWAAGRAVGAPAAQTQRRWD